MGSEGGQYLANTNMTAKDIAFPLGYQEICSFLCAFSLRNGQTINGYKKNSEINR